MPRTPPTKTPSRSGLIRPAQTPRRRRQALFAAAGVSIMVAAGGVFYLTADAFDEREPVLVTAGALLADQPVSAADFASLPLILDDAPHIPYSPEVVAAFDGLAPVSDLPPNAVVLLDHFYDPAAAAPAGPRGDLRTALSLTPSALRPEPLEAQSTVLIVDVGEPPSRSSRGRPATVIGDPVVLGEGNDWDGAQLVWYDSVETWPERQATYGHLDGHATAINVHPERAATVRDTLQQRWHDEWIDATAAAGWPLDPGTGDWTALLPVIVPPHSRPVSNGDFVLLVDPGAAAGPDPLAAAAPPRLIEHRRVDGYDGAALRLEGLSPSDYAFYTKLAAALVPEMVRVNDDPEWRLDVPCGAAEPRCSDAGTRLGLNAQAYLDARICIAHADRYGYTPSCPAPLTAAES